MKGSSIMFPSTPGNRFGKIHSLNREKVSLLTAQTVIIHMVCKISFLGVCKRTMRRVSEQEMMVCKRDNALEL